LAIKWKDIRDVFFLTTAHEDVLVEAQSSKGAHHKIKPAAVLDHSKYKADLERSPDVVILFILKEDNKMVKETFLSPLQPGNGQCTHLAQQNKQEGKSLEIFYKKVAEGLLASAGMEI